MAKRPTLQDVAREAGVSIATVNRVVSAAPGVREDTARRVADAAARVGYHGKNLIAQNVLHSLPEVRVGVVLHKEKQEFYRGFTGHVLETAKNVSTARVSVVLRYAPTQAPEDVAQELRSLIGQVDVVAATAVNHRLVTEAVKDLNVAGIPCVSLLSEFALGETSGYYGLNNLKVGRGVARCLSSNARKPGRIALFVGGNRWHGHELREAGFRSQFREAEPGFHLHDTLINLETRRLTYEAMLDLLGRYPDIVGVYLAGGGMEGAIAAVREETNPRQIALIVNEDTRDSRQALDDGYVSAIVATPLEQLCRTLLEDCVAFSAEGKGLPGQRFFDPLLLLPEFF